MFTGNKEWALNFISTLVSEVLMGSFQINWEAESSRHAKVEFLQLSLLVAEKVLSNIEDTGCEVPFYCGKPSKDNINQGIECVKEFYKQKGFGEVAIKRKVKKFRDELEDRLTKLFKVWEQQRKQFYRKGEL